MPTETFAADGTIVLVARHGELIELVLTSDDEDGDTVQVPAMLTLDEAAALAEALAEVIAEVSDD